MKIIKIIKRYNCASKEHFLVLLDDSMDNFDIEIAVEDWCDSDSAGRSYAYSSKWLIVEDSEIINKVLKDKIKIIDGNISRLENEKSKMLEYIN